MLAKSLVFPSLVLALAAFAACATEDPLPTSGTLPGDERPFVATPGSFIFYTLRPDAERGGFLVRSVNLDVTRCGDDSYQPECHVDDLDLASLGLDDEQEKRVRDAAAQERAVVRGELGASLVASEAWLAITESRIEGEIARVTNTGIVCIAAPCPTMHAVVLNTKMEHDIADLDFRPSGASPKQVELALAARGQDHGVLVAGKEYRVTGPAGEMPGIQVLQFFLPVPAAPAASESDPAACYVGGCSGELCTDEPGATSICIERPEYACYRTATCERQADLRCGWTMTDELRQCLDASSAPDR